MDEDLFADFPPGVFKPSPFKTWPQQAADLPAFQHAHEPESESDSETEDEGVVASPSRQPSSKRAASKQLVQSKAATRGARRGTKAESQASPAQEAVISAQALCRAAQKKARAQKPGKNTPPLLELGRVVCFLPVSTGQLVVRVGQNSRGMNLVWTVDLGDGHPEAEAPNKFCSIPYRHLLKFATTGLSSHPPPQSNPASWVWTYVHDQRLPPKPFSPQSMQLLTAAYLEQRKRCSARDPNEKRHDPDPRVFAWSVFLPHERMSVNLLSVFGLFAVPEPALNEPLLKFPVFVK